MCIHSLIHANMMMLDNENNITTLDLSDCYDADVISKMIDEFLRDFDPLISQPIIHPQK